MSPLALALALALGGPDAREAAIALEAGCRDVGCLVEGMLWGWHESGLNRQPKAESHDARDGTSCGLFQTPCAETPRADVAGQVRVWLRHRDASLAAFGDLRALPGATPAGLRITESRAAEARWLAELAAASIEMSPANP